jgi:hypothetical protein
MFLLTMAFVGFSGYAFTWQWFTRLDDFYAGVPGPVAPSSALLVELRQRQLLTVLSRNAPRGSQSTMASPRGSGARVRPEEPQLDLSAIDAMYEQAMAGPVCGPLLRLFLAEYIRYATGTVVVAMMYDPEVPVMYSPRASCSMSTHLVCGRVHVRNRHLETVQLRTLEKMSVPFDVAFFVMLRQRGVKAADRADRPDGGTQAWTLFHMEKAEEMSQGLGRVGEVHCVHWQ